MADVSIDEVAHYRAMRSAVLLVAVAAMSFGCKKGSDPSQGAPPAATTPVATTTPPAAMTPTTTLTPTAPATETPAPPPTVPAAAADSSADKVTKTGVLDLELVEHGGMYVMRDNAYEVTFPVKPEITGDTQSSDDGTKIHVATALADKGDDVAGFFLMPIPAGIPYDVKAGLDAARDQSIAKVGGKLVSDVPTKFGGLDGRKITANANAEGRAVNFVEYLAFDKKHHTVVGVILIAFGAFGPFEDTVVSSFIVKPGAAPPAGNGN